MNFCFSSAGQERPSRSLFFSSTWQADTTTCPHPASLPGFPSIPHSFNPHLLWPSQLPSLLRPHSVSRAEARFSLLTTTAQPAPCTVCVQATRAASNAQAVGLQSMASVMGREAYRQEGFKLKGKPAKLSLSARTCQHEKPGGVAVEDRVRHLSQDIGRLLTAHHTDPRVGPCKQKSGAVRSPTHAVVAGPWPITTASPPRTACLQIHKEAAPIKLLQKAVHQQAAFQAAQCKGGEGLTEAAANKECDLRHL